MSSIYSSIKKRTYEQEQLFTLQNLSPQKYGKAAYANLTYTPSKLSENVLFKEVSNQKKLQEGSSKLRETQTLNSIFQDRLSELRQQKQGIEKTLSEQIMMYKRMLKQKQDKNEKRIKLLQQSFNYEMKMMLEHKEQQAKFSQSQKQLLQARIAELQAQQQELRNELENYSGGCQDLRVQNEKLQLLIDDLSRKLQQTQKKSQKQQEKLIEQMQTLKRQLYESGLQWQRQLEKQQNQRKKQIENLERLHRNQLQKIQHKRAQQVLIKNQQLKQLSGVFEKQTARLNAIIAKKQEQILVLNKTAQTEKDKTFAAFKGYENDITALTSEKTRLKEDLLKAQRKLQKLTTQHEQLQQQHNGTKSDTQTQLAQLQKDLQLNQLHYMRQLDKAQFTLQQSSKQLTRLKQQNNRISTIQQENIILCKQIITMRQLLTESSVEIDKCKEEFLRMYQERDVLVMRLKEIGVENQALYVIKNDREQEARGWRESYYIQKERRY